MHAKHYQEPRIREDWKQRKDERGGQAAIKKIGSRDANEKGRARGRICRYEELEHVKTTAAIRAGRNK